MIFFRSKARQKTVLVADDDVVVRALIGNVLESAGYRILDAGNGREAVDMAAGELPDIIVMDLGMPMMTGIAAIAALRAEPKTRQIPILVCSAHDSFDNVDQCAALGVKDFIVKPFDSARLLAKVKELIERGRKPA
ncbi:MAG: response regulator [Elusimicrobia bacterium]|nr:response regulator [Elusimicrobiota bacterium]